jgi:O-antigen biosynthesis protein
MPVSSVFLSFIIPLHNHVAHSQAMLDGLLASLPANLTFEVILVDDASSDATAQWLAGLQDRRVRFVVNPENLGYAASNNRGVALARGEFLGLLNNDLLFSPGWLEPMLALFSGKGPAPGVVGNVQRRVVDDEIDHAGICLNLRGQFEHVRALPAGVDSAEVPWVTGACLLLRRAVFLSCGGFDTGYRNGCEDVDLCFRLRQAGLRVMVAYRSVIRHHVSLSRGANSLQNEHNSRLLFSRWREDIRRALALHWSTQLAAGPVAPSFLDGSLAEDFVATPVLAGRMLAENRLCIQEARWARLLDTLDTLDVPVPQVWAAGAQVRATGGVQPLARTLLLQLAGCKALEAFQVYGECLPGLPFERLRIRVVCNGLQSKVFPVRTSGPFCVGLAQPVLLPLELNRVELFFEWDEPVEACLVLSSLVFLRVAADGLVLPLGLVRSHAQARAAINVACK